MIKWNIDEYTRKNYILRFEDLFNKREPLKNWSFGDRVYLEMLDPMTTKQLLLRYLNQDPEILSWKDEKMGNIYLGLYFRSPPGLSLYKQWVLDTELIPDFPGWRQKYRSLFKEYKIHQLFESNKKLLQDEEPVHDKTKAAKKDPSKDKKVSQTSDPKTPVLDAGPEKSANFSTQEMEEKFGLKKFINISEDDMGEVAEKRTLCYPSDGSVIDVITLNTSHEKRNRI